MNSPIIDLSSSPQALMQPVPVTAVKLHDKFWQPRREINARRTIFSQIKQCRETGRLENFVRAAGKSDAPFQGIFFNDSDVYKVLEAAGWSLATNPDAALDAEVDDIIATVGAAQQPDGYLNTYFMFERADQRWKNLKDMHELYCAGHLFQAAVAHFRGTGKTSLLQIACKFADCINKEFGPNGTLAACGHEEAEMALVELYRVTRDERYLVLAHRMVSARGQSPGMFQNSEYHQDHLPFAQQKMMIGHAVRHMYLCCGATDVVLENGDAGFRDGLENLWHSFVGSQMYVTGGAGARYEGEAFGAPYELPNDRAYTETCAAIGSVMWQFRMLHLTGQQRFADLMEHTMINAVLPGLALDGEHYFYENPLENDGTHRRSEWFGCACCPPNVARLLAQLPGYFASQGCGKIWLHMYADMDIELTDTAGKVRLAVEADMPWQPDVKVRVVEAVGSVTLCLRIPVWAEGSTVTQNGISREVAAGAYVTVEAACGDVIGLHLPLTVQQLTAHPFVSSNYHQTAIQRGPVVYCAEQVDQPLYDVRTLRLPANVTVEAHHSSQLLGGVTTLLLTAAVVPSPSSDEPLYSDYRRSELPVPAEVVLIPHFAWANRAPGPMRVWLPQA